MRIPKFAIGLATIVAALFFFGCGDDDNPSNPGGGTIPAQIVGTWWWNSATVDGVPMTFQELSFTDSSDAQSLTFNSNGTYSSAEFYQSTSVWTQSGTFSGRQDTLIITKTMENGAPITPDTEWGIWEVSGDTLIWSREAIIITDTIMVIARYLKD